MNRKILPGLVGVLLLLVVAAGAFYGGMRFQGMRSSGTRANFLQIAVVLMAQILVVVAAAAGAATWDR